MARREISFNRAARAPRPQCARCLTFRAVSWRAPRRRRRGGGGVVSSKHPTRLPLSFLNPPPPRRRRRAALQKANTAAVQLVGQALQALRGFQVSHPLHGFIRALRNPAASQHRWHTQCWGNALGGATHVLWIWIRRDHRPHPADSVADRSPVRSAFGGGVAQRRRRPTRELGKSHK